MTFDIFSLLILILAIVGMYLGWRASIYIGHLFLVLWRMSIAVCFGLGTVYLFYICWPWLVELQHQGQIHFPVEMSRWEIVVR